MDFTTFCCIYDSGTLSLICTHAGNILSFTVTQLLDTVSAEKWYQFSRNASEYLFLASSSQSEYSALFEWRGVFVLVHNLPTVNATAAAFFSTADDDLLIVTNSGYTGNREINSTVYRFTEGEQIEFVRSA